MDYKDLRLVTTIVPSGTKDGIKTYKDKWGNYWSPYKGDSGLVIAPFAAGKERIVGKIIEDQVTGCPLSWDLEISDEDIFKFLELIKDERVS